MTHRYCHWSFTKPRIIRTSSADRTERTAFISHIQIWEIHWFILKYGLFLVSNFYNMKHLIRRIILCVPTAVHSLGLNLVFDILRYIGCTISRFSSLKTGMRHSGRKIGSTSIWCHCSWWNLKIQKFRSSRWNMSDLIVNCRSLRRISLDWKRWLSLRLILN